MDSIIDTLRWLLMWIDFAVYTMIEKIYYLFLMLSEATVLNDEIITNFTSKVYVLISLIMLFRLAFSFINYIVNPDTITDKQKGGGKLITNIVISIALLVSIPTIFHELYYLQGVIVQQNVIEKLVLGESTITENGEDSQITAANYLSLYAFTSFFTPNQAIPGCAEPFTVSNGVRTLTSSCLSALDQASTKDKNVGTNYNNALTSADLMYIAQGGMADEKAAVTNSQYVIEKEYLFDYSYIISTIFGLALCFVLIGFCFDLAIRIIKLGFLQLIAPIPIVLNMAPASKNNYLGNFGKEVVSTWVSLFIRIAVVTFAIYFIQLVFMSGVTSFVSGEVVSNPFVNAFVMMGLLMFAKEFPKLLEELLGLKGAGKLTLNPVKKINEGMIGGGLIGGAVAGLAGGGIGGAIRGAWAGRNAKTLTDAAGKSLRQSVDRRVNLRQAREDGSTLGGRMSQRFNSTFGLPTAMETISGAESELAARKRDFDRRIQNIEDVINPVRDGIKARESMQKHYEERESVAKDLIQKGKAGTYSNRYQQLEREASVIESKLQSASTDTERETFARQLQTKKSEMGRELSSMSRSVITDVANGTLTGDNYNDLNNLFSIGQSMADTNGLGEAYIRDGAAANAAITTMKTAIATAKGSIMEQEQQIDTLKRQKDALKEHERNLAERKRIAQANEKAVRNGKK